MGKRLRSRKGGFQELVRQLSWDGRYYVFATGNKPRTAPAAARGQIHPEGNGCFVTALAGSLRPETRPGAR